MPLALGGMLNVSNQRGLGLGALPGLAGSWEAVEMGQCLDQAGPAPSRGWLSASAPLGASCTMRGDGRAARWRQWPGWDSTGYSWDGSSHAVLQAPAPHQGQINPNTARKNKKWESRG